MACCLCTPTDCCCILTDDCRLLHVYEMRERRVALVKLAQTLLKVLKFDNVPILKPVIFHRRTAAMLRS